jgi:YD repeat-containing protein
MKFVVFGTVVFMIVVKMITNASAEPQTRFYDARGNSIGTAVPQGEGSTRYYDAGGRSLGTSTTMPGGGTRTFYGPSGNVTGRASSPPFHGSHGGRR